MDKFKLNMIGGGFQHDVCSSAYNIPQFVEWNKQASVNVYIDGSILNFTIDKTKHNIAWFSESKAVINHIFDACFKNVNNYDKLLKSYDLIVTHDKNILKMYNNEKIKYIIPSGKSWITDKKIYDKSKKLSFITSNKSFAPGHKKRHNFICKNREKFDLFGFGFKNIENKNIGLNDYMFSVAIENDSYDDYFSEKITDCFSTGTIPIYWGNPNISNWFDTNGIIEFTDEFDIDILTKDLYYSKIDSIKHNLEKTKNLITAEDYLYLTYLKQ